MRRRSAGRILAVVGAVMFGCLLTAAPAAAHNVLIESDPEDGASMERGPESITLTFLSSLDPDNSDLTVEGPDGDAVDGAPEFDGGSVSVPVDTAGPGDYELRFEVLSDDGHIVTGTVGFSVTVGEQPTPEPTPEPSPEPSPEPTLGPAVPTVEPAAQAEPDGGGAGWLWLLVGLVLVAAGALLLWRRRRP